MSILDGDHDVTAVRHAAPTLEMVAARAGVSRATVSRVVNGSDKVNPSSIEAVRQAIAELGYVPNRAARSLASAQSHAIALVVPEDITRFFGDVFFASIVAGLNDRLDQSDYVLNLMVASQDPGGKTERYLLGGAVDGAVVVSHHTSDHFLERIGDAIPLVFGGRPGLENIDTWVVDVDNEEGGAVAARRLVERGCTKIATITGPTDMQSALERTRGWKRVVEAAGLEPGPQVDGDFSMVGGALAMRELLDQYPDVDGVFVASDLMASGAMPVILESGRRIPEDVAVVGYDDSPAALACPVPLTTVLQPSEAMGRAMADILLDVLAGGERQRSTIMPIELVERESA
ncbi:LacI family DNA-binding transcriptional regulator [Demequina zhanjiangensis]|uniref:LacI family DNA-binding transcriptional regulator n=1 Tax=Demequina zhanjiangensis TaxID=3051659 RepID=A0ABT8FYC6_9MICO|nr:LacI family DNA-binding transcriptional regulator [Demequina sp. SYSU T00b26]MDN4471813.1 LacI family DNA-binding transcriptional regulator [Demequina sp. SYSU T00b26]